MAALQRTFRLAPTWTHQPDGNISLGSVIPDPSRPDRAIRRVHLPEYLITCTRQQNFLLDRTRAEETHRELWSTLARSIPKDNKRKTTAIIRERFAIEDLETLIIETSEKFLAACVYDDEVQQYTRLNSSDPIYLITGLKIATGATMETFTNYNRRTDDGSNSGSTQSQPAVNVTQDDTVDNEMVRFDSSEAFVFAYELLEIAPRDDGSVEVREATSSISGVVLGQELSSDDVSRVVKQFEDEWFVTPKWSSESAASKDIISVPGLDHMLSLR